MKKNGSRNGCVDVFNAFLIENAKFEGMFDFPCIDGSDEIPNKLIPFSKTTTLKETDAWVHFFEDDVMFERIWRNPRHYLGIIKRYKGMILVDFSLYRDMPLIMQLWNIFRSRAMGSYFERNGINVIPNIRFGDERTFEMSCVGIRQNSIIAIGSHGTIKDIDDRQIFTEGLDYVVKRLRPKVIVIYGSVPKGIFDKYRHMGIEIVHFKSCYSVSERVVE